MILTLEDDGCVHVYPSLDAVVLAIEALDAEECLRAVFDDAGQRYVVDWIRPNREGWLGVDNGQYRLVPSGQRDPKALVAALEEAGDRGLTEHDRDAVHAVKLRLATAT